VDTEYVSTEQKIDTTATTPNYKYLVLLVVLLLLSEILLGEYSGTSQ
jgi:hypothetical protein